MGEALLPVTFAVGRRQARLAGKERLRLPGGDEGLEPQGLEQGAPARVGRAPGVSLGARSEARLAADERQARDPSGFCQGERERQARAERIASEVHATWREQLSEALDFV